MVSFTNILKGSRILLKFFLQVLGQLRVLTVIHRTVNDAWLILLKGILQNRNQILCLFHSIPFRMHAFRIFHKIGVREIHITLLSKTVDLLPFNEASEKISVTIGVPSRSAVSYS